MQEEIPPVPHSANSVETKPLPDSQFLTQSASNSSADLTNANPPSCEEEKQPITSSTGPVPPLAGPTTPPPLPPSTDTPSPVAANDGEEDLTQPPPLISARYVVTKNTQRLVSY